MARALRLEFSGALYHVTSSGDRREEVHGCELVKGRTSIERCVHTGVRSIGVRRETADEI